MKSKTIILLLFLFSNTVFLPAQKNDDVYSYSSKSDNSNRIDNGYVFIHGKYFKPPYRIERKGFSVYINGVEALKYKKPVQIRYKYPGYPPQITKNSSIDDMLDIKPPGSDLPYINVAEEYFKRKYKKGKIVKKKLIKYIQGFPNVKYYDGSHLETYNGETRNFWIIIKRAPNANELKKIIDKTIEGIKSLLELKFVLIFYPEHHKEKIKTKEFICSILYLHNKNKPDDEIIDYLIKANLTGNGERKWLKSFLKELDYNINLCNENEYKVND